LIWCNFLQPPVTSPQETIYEEKCFLNLSGYKKADTKLEQLFWRENIWFILAMKYLAVYSNFTIAKWSSTSKKSRTSKQQLLRTSGVQYT
jgi:type II secretory pathway component PulL